MSDHSVGPSRLPVAGSISLIVVVTVLAVLSTLIAAPVVLAALLSDKVKSSGPSIIASSFKGRLISRSVIDAPSPGAV